LIKCNKYNAIFALILQIIFIEHYIFNLIFQLAMLNNIFVIKSKKYIKKCRNKKREGGRGKAKKFNTIFALILQIIIILIEYSIFNLIFQLAMLNNIFVIKSKRYIKKCRNKKREGGRGKAKKFAIFGRLRIIIGRESRGSSRISM